MFHRGAITTAIRLLSIVANKLVGPASAADARWPQFRGPSGLGYCQETNLPLTWSARTGENILWKSPLPGQGHASPIVWDDAVFVCTVRWPSNGLPREAVIPDHHVTRYRASDGRIVWDTLVPPGPWLRKDFRSGPGGGYAAPTPATDGHLLYCAFGSSVLAALDFQGKLVWRKEIVPASFDVTVGSSPVLYRDTVIFLCAMAKPSDSRVVAFDKANGEVKWQSPLPGMGFGHSTPLIIPVKGKSQMLVLASGMSVTEKALRALDPSSGRLLWWCRGAGDAASPAFGSGLVYFDSGRGGPGEAVDPTGAGDVSATHIRWTVRQVPEGIGSPIIVEGRVYRLHSPGILKCWDLAAGRQVYAERLEGISSTWASPIADPAGRLYFANGGKSYVLQAGPEFRVLAVNDLNDGNHPSPAAANGKLFLAGLKNLYCVGNTPATAGKAESSK
jgi:outer membrane protein assembly factor BamB